MIAVSEKDAKNLLKDLQNTIPCAKIIGYIEEKVGFPLESKTSLPITFSMHKRFFNFCHILLYENNSGIISLVGCFYTYH